MKSSLTESYEPINVLLAEDDADDQFLFSDTISQFPFTTQVTIVENGIDLLEKLQDKKFVPDIVFLDLNMPKMDGKECLKFIRNNQRFNDIPCVIFSTSSSPVEIEETFNNGANLYLVKPTEGNNLIKMIHDVLLLNWRKYFPPQRELFFITETSLQKLN